MSDYGNIEKSILVDAVSQSYFVIKCDDDGVQLCPSGGGDDLFFSREQLLAMIELIGGGAIEAQGSGEPQAVVDASKILEERLRAEADKNCSFEWSVIKMDKDGCFTAYKEEPTAFPESGEWVIFEDMIPWCQLPAPHSAAYVDIDWQAWEIRK